MNIKIIYVQLFIGFILVNPLLSCKKNFLSRNPVDEISSGNFWHTAADAELGLAGCYQRLKSGGQTSATTNNYGNHNFFGYARYVYEGLTDNAYQVQNYVGVSDILVGNLASTSDLPLNIWSYSYGGVSSCNIFLQNIGNVEMDASLKSIDIGEVHFLRAFFYFELVNCFGDVPLYKLPPTIEEANHVIRAPKAEVLDLIYADLDTAISLLPDIKYNGHAVKGSALALKARVYLYNEQWQNAADLCNQVMQSGTFSLFHDYGALFFTKNKRNSEVIFATNYSAPNDLQGVTGGLDIELGKQVGLNTYQSFVDQYETSDGKMITDPTSGYDPANPYANRDPRLLMSIRVPGQNYHSPDGTILPLSANTLTPYYVYKYVDSTLWPINNFDLNKDDEDFIQIRYADVLLMYAEATNEATGPDASVYQAINQVRARVNLPPVDQTTYGDQASLREYIRHERRIELAFEGLRYFDLKRWRIADQVIPDVVTPGGVHGKFPSYFYLLPIPQAEININPNLTQNPGY